MDNNFGSCYPRGAGTCTYDEERNTWIVCPTGFNGCIGERNATGMCCDTSYMMCSKPSGICIAGDWASTTESTLLESSSGSDSASSSHEDTSSGLSATSETSDFSRTDSPSSSQGQATCTSTNCGAGLLCCPDDYHGAACFESSQYWCTTNELGLHLLCPANYMSCGKQCYSPTEYTCFLSQDRTQNSLLCPRGLMRCNDACYSTSRFICNSGSLFGLPPGFNN
eukprot:TRINITY_DN1386_c0_g1_i2.p1 TRINITY_DN1386_c0_g1~~TRINITY_DN1386_c0_g1_i2.p1  ORF type:complete len:224 (+),score=19.21 TRINITY_DN1386_c0_g1_i2:362-1033(+)